MSKLNIVCVAVVGQQNQPLYIKAFGEDVDGHLHLRLHHVVHCSLDAMEERGKSAISLKALGRYEPDVLKEPCVLILLSSDYSADEGTR
eukprot:1016676-Pelagomonas_calceolata.AAC.3